MPEKALTARLQQAWVHPQQQLPQHLPLTLSKTCGRQGSRCVAMDTAVRVCVVLRSLTVAMSRVQTALERALAKHPASMEKNARWKAISADVPGKSKKQCIMRFRQLRQELLAKKKAAKKK